MDIKTIAISMTDSHLLNTGLGEFENSIAIRLARRAPELRSKYGIRLLFIVEECQVGAYGPDVDYHVISPTKRALLKMWFMAPLRRWLMPKIDLLHWTDQFFKFRIRLAPIQLMTIHDVNFMHNNISKSSIMRKSLRMRRRMAQMTHFSFISKFTEQDVLHYFPTNLPERVIYNGVTNLNTESADTYEQTLKDMNVPKDFLFHISRWSDKKNVLLQLEMMQHLPNEHLVLAGSGKKKFEQSVKDTIERLSLHNVTVVGRISTEQKAALLSRCKALIFPSLSEGFGLPVAEAMCFGKPSFITRLTSLPEIGGDINYYFTSLDAKQMAKDVEQGLADFATNPDSKAQALKQRAATFSWDNSADGYIQYYLDLLKK